MSGNILGTLSLKTGGAHPDLTSTETSGTKPIVKTLTQSRILRFYTPLALSWLFMAIEGPITAGIVQHMSQPQINAAALFVMFSLSIFIESPVIDLLSTATTLTKSHQSYIVLRKFSLILIAIVTVVHAGVALSPVYWWVTLDLIGLKSDVAVTMRPAMAIMIPWSAFIGWRRFLHGVMIRWNKTRPVGIGTAIRVVMVLIVGLSLYFKSSLSGVVVVAIAMVTGVICESVFIHFAGRSVVKKYLDPTIGQDVPDPLTLRRLFVFHSPLTLATMVMIAGMPLVAWGLAKTPDSVVMMASWQVATSLMFVFRTVTFALPETVIALYKDTASRRALAKFCTRVGAACSILVLVTWATGLDNLVFVDLMGVDPAIVPGARLAFILTGALPFVNGYASLIRGVLTAHHLTTARLVAIVVAVAGLFAILVSGVEFGWPGLLMAALAVSVSQIAEVSVLLVFWNRSKSSLADSPL